MHLQLFRDFRADDSYTVLEFFIHSTIVCEFPPKIRSATVQSNEHANVMLTWLRIWNAVNFVGEKCVLGLATGSSPSQIYRFLVKEHKKNGLSFKHVITFNLDEYYPMDPKTLQSYHRFMHESLFDHVDIQPQNIHIPDGQVAKADLKRWDIAYFIQFLGQIETREKGLNQ